jgi:hypothetical protein
MSRTYTYVVNVKYTDEDGIARRTRKTVDARNESAARTTVAGLFAYEFPTWKAQSFEATLKEI